LISIWQELPLEVDGLIPFTNTLLIMTMLMRII
jgi:hypothetical protein